MLDNNNTVISSPSFFAVRLARMGIYLTLQAFNFPYAVPSFHTEGGGSNLVYLLCLPLSKTLVIMECQEIGLRFVAYLRLRNLN